MIITFTYSDFGNRPLSNVLEYLEDIKDKGYECYFKGKGNGEVNLIMEKK